MKNFQVRIIPSVGILFLLVLAPVGLSAQEQGGSSNPLADLQSTDPYTQVTGCRKVAEAKNGQAINPLIQLLETSSNREVQWNAALALGMIGQAGPATDALLKSAKGSGYKSVRYASLLGLANLQDPNKKSEFMDVVKWTQENSNDDLAKDLVEKIRSKAGI